jgi:DNA replication protein DnaC
LFGRTLGRSAGGGSDDFFKDRLGYFGDRFGLVFRLIVMLRQGYLDYTGVGKSWLACALGHKACRDNRSVLYQRIPRLFTDLALAHGDGRYPRLMRALGGVKLLILDDWGLEPLGPEQRHDLLEIAEERYGRGATLITSQLPVDRWHNVIGDPTLADAILDRIVHNAHRLQLKGDSLRKQTAANSAAA